MIPEHMYEYCKDSVEEVEAHAGMPWSEMAFSMPPEEMMYEILMAGVLPIADTYEELR